MQPVKGSMNPNKTDLVLCKLLFTLLREFAVFNYCIQESFFLQKFECIIELWGVILNISDYKNCEKDPWRVSEAQKEKTKGHIV